MYWFNYSAFIVDMFCIHLLTLVAECYISGSNKLVCKSCTD